VGKVTASLDTSHYKGHVAKTVTVTTDEPGAHPVVLQLAADVVTVVDVLPGEVTFLRGTAGEPLHADVTVAATSGEAFDVLTVDADPSVHATVTPAAPVAHRGTPKKPRPVATGASRYTISVKPTEKAPIGQSMAKVMLTTTLAKAEKVPISVALSLTGPVQVVPVRLLVQPAAPVLHARISRRDGPKLRILGIESSDPDFSVTQTTVAAGREYDLAVRYTGKPGRGPVDARITVRTNEPRQAAVVIPVSGRI